MGYKIIWGAARKIPGVLNTEQAPGSGLPGNRDRGSHAKMDVSKILNELRQEKDQLEEAILSLERLAAGRGKRRGRPPTWMSEAKKRGRPPGSKNKSAAEKAEASSSPV
jgi:hypothetical protein